MGRGNMAQVREQGVSSDVKAVALLVAAITVVAALIGEEVVSMLFSPVIVLGILYMLVKAPLRTSLLALVFLGLTLENPAEMPANGHFKSPFFNVGGLLLTHINTVVKIPLPVSGMEIMLVLLLVIAQQRRSSGSKIDKVGWVPTPQPLVQLAYLTFAGIVWVLLIGF